MEKLAANAYAKMLAVSIRWRRLIKKKHVERTPAASGAAVQTRGDSTTKPQPRNLQLFRPKASRTGAHKLTCPQRCEIASLLPHRFQKGVGLTQQIWSAMLVLVLVAPALAGTQFWLAAPFTTKTAALHRAARHGATERARRHQEHRARQ